MENYRNIKVRLYGGIRDGETAFVKVDEDDRPIKAFIEFYYPDLNFGLNPRVLTYQREIYTLETLCRKKRCWLIGLHSTKTIHEVINEINREGDKNA